jgi:2-polyprenyl-3-methyl-5-hydroxy-6-metoxy-1,4-benzoquinol methylase
MNEKQHPVCPNCGTGAMTAFCEVSGAPVHSVLLLPTRAEAVDFPRGDIRLGVCGNCGFVSNLAFDADMHEYGGRYEATQAYSGTFNAFHRRLATELVRRFDLYRKQIIEIGCGQGDFLELLCEIGSNRGLGFDPAYAPERRSAPPSPRVSFIQDFYSKRYAQHTADFVVCKMTLEHIPKTAEFVSLVRRAISERPDTTVFFQVPDFQRILEKTAFWDVYYEHCSYFTAVSLARLFRSAGFEVLDLWRDYDDQYLMVAARPGAGAARASLPVEDAASQISQAISHFDETMQSLLATWRNLVHKMMAHGRRVVLWGGGSKGVAFLTMLGISPDDIAYVVDINPHKSGSFIAGTGQQVVSPLQLQRIRPDAVIVMNPVYREEISRDLNELGLSPELLCATDDPVGVAIQSDSAAAVGHSKP